MAMARCPTPEIEQYLLLMSHVRTFGTLSKGLAGSSHPTAV